MSLLDEIGRLPRRKGALERNLSKPDRRTQSLPRPLHICPEVMIQSIKDR